MQFELDPPPPISNLGLTFIQTNAIWVNVHTSWKTIFWPKFLSPERPQFCGQFQITSIVIKNYWMKSKCVTSDKLYQSISSYELITKFWTKFRPKKARGLFFFDSWDYLNLLDIMVVYHSMQNEEILMSSSRENEFGDKNNLETSLNGAQIWP